ncbi:cyanate permease [Streptococcus pneumoniae]|nr:cyanate permease [Streptococcus pneumoniae]
MKKQSLFFVPGIILIGVSLRTPFTVLPIILGNISQGLEVEVSSLGVLTSLPLLMFTLFSPFSTRLAQKIGLEHLFTYSLFFLTIGSLIRLINLPLLYLGTLMVGASVAVINVLLPSLYPSQSTKENWFSDHLICNVYGDCNGSGFLSSCAHYTSQFLERTYPPPHVTLSSNFFGLAPKSPL